MKCRTEQTSETEEYAKALSETETNGKMNSNMTNF